LIVFDVKESDKPSAEIDHSIKACQKHGHATKGEESIATGRKCQLCIWNGILADIRLICIQFRSKYSQKARSFWRYSYGKMSKH